MNISGINAGFSINTFANAASSRNDRPGFNANQVYNSLGDLSSSLHRYQDEWEGVYAAEFAAMENGGAMTVEELTEYMRNEFAGFGVQFIDYNPKDVSQGRHLVYIDEINLRKMADDPEYRAENLALMQREFAGQGGFSFRDSRRVVNSKLTGTVFSLCEENPKVGGSRYAGMAQGASITVSTETPRGGGTRGKSVQQAVAERQAELRERARIKKEKERIETNKQEQRERLDKFRAPRTDAEDAVEETSTLPDDSPAMGRSIDTRA